MPGYKGHLLGGAAAFGVTFAIIGWCCASRLTAGEWLLCSLVGSLFPDVDIKSKGQKLFYSLLLIVLVVLIIKQRLDLLAGLSLCAVVPLIVRHRGLFHNTLFIIALPFAVWFLMQSVFPDYKHVLLFDTMFFVAGAISHLILDRGVRRTFSIRR
jgi:hypothetical protein